MPPSKSSGSSASSKSKPRPPSKGRPPPPPSSFDDHVYLSAEFDPRWIPLDHELYDPRDERSYGATMTTRQMRKQLEYVYRRLVSDDLEDSSLAYTEWQGLLTKIIKEETDHSHDYPHEINLLERAWASVGLTFDDAILQHEAQRSLTHRELYVFLRRYGIDAKNGRPNYQLADAQRRSNSAQAELRYDVIMKGQLPDGSPTVASILPPTQPPSSLVNSRFHTSTQIPLRNHPFSPVCPSATAGNDACLQS